MSKPPSPSLVDQPIETAAKKHLPTIGITGYTALEIAKLNKKIVHYCNSLGFKDDQDHPNLISVSLDTNNKVSHLQNCASICNDYGCDIIAIADKKGSTSLDEDISKALRIPVLMPEDNSEKDDDQIMADFAKKIVDNALAIPIDKIKRPDLVYKDISSKKEENTINERIQKDDLTTQKRLAESEEEGRHAVLKLDNNKNVSFVIGGAGPLASAELTYKLAEQAIPFIHVSINCAPGKHRFETADGPPYMRHYESALNFADNLLMGNVGSVIIPCNTAHLRLDEIFKNHQSYLEKIIDFRFCVLSEKSIKYEKLYLLGTAATTGIDDPENGNYEKYRSRNFKDFESFVIPNKDQQEKITEAIFDVKAGRMAVAKAKILAVVEELRDKNGYHPLVLGCTELPLPFTTAELAGYNLIDPATLVAQKVKDIAKGKPTRGNNYKGLETLADRFQKTVQATRRRSISNTSATSAPRIDSSASSSDSEEHHFTSVDINKAEALKPFIITYDTGNSGLNRRLRIKTKNTASDVQNPEFMINLSKSILEEFKSPSKGTKDRVSGPNSEGEMIVSLHQIEENPKKKNFEDWLEKHNIAEKKDLPKTKMVTTSPLSGAEDAKSLVGTPPTNTISLLKSPVAAKLKHLQQLYPEHSTSV